MVATPKEWKRLRVTVTPDPDSPSYPAWDDGLRWNGFLVPLVTWQTARRIKARYWMADLQETGNSFGTFVRVEGITFEEEAE